MEWIFSGVGVAILAGIVGVFLRSKKRDQNIKAGSGSTNIQAGNGAQITIRPRPADADEPPSQIQKATLEDVGKYDPKTRELIRAANREIMVHRRMMMRSRSSPLRMLLTGFMCLAVLGGIVYLIVKLIQLIMSKS